MALAEQMLTGRPLELAGIKVLVTQRCTVMTLGAGVIASICPTAVKVVAGESVTTLPLPPLAALAPAGQS